MGDSYENLGDTKHLRPLRRPARHSDCGFPPTGDLDVFPPDTPPAGSHGFHYGFLARKTSRQSALRLGEPEGILTFVLGEASLSEPGVFLQDSPNAVDVCEVHAKSELLPFFLLACRKVSLNIHAGGIAEKLPDLPSPIRMLAKFVYGQCDEAVVLTEFSRQDAEALGIKQIAVLPNRLQDSYDPAKVARTATSAELLYVGHFSDLKGVPNLLHAVAQLRHENPDIRLNLVGEPLWPLTEEEVASMIDKLGLNEIVRLKGLQLGDTKWTSYATADLLVFPSTALESFPLVLLEAMMWGLPVVATDWRAHSEILGPDPGGVCYPVDEDPRKALTGALAQALGQRSRWKEWGERNRARYTAMDSIEPDPLISYARRAVEA